MSLVCPGIDGKGCPKHYSTDDRSNYNRHTMTCGVGSGGGGKRDNAGSGGKRVGAGRPFKDPNDPRRLGAASQDKMSGTRGAAKKEAPVKSKTKKPNSSSATQEVLPVQDTSSQGGGGGEQIEDTSSEGGGGGEQIDTTSSSQDVDAHQALCRPHDDDAPTPKQLALAHAIKAHYDNHCR
mmetsp:Transcript_40868/g.80456  ORF Transcript_40868/g.80456 Transcript_40868/m.80456 type:complete len:180 (+) Transcript_40868:365-904(+)